MNRILIIDDDDSMRSVMRRVLTRAGYETLEASDGQSGLKALESQPIDLVVTDMIMPEMDGIELIFQLRRTHPDLRIIATSGGGRLGTGNYLKLAQAGGAAMVLSKPFEVDELVGAVQKLLQA